MLAEFFTQLLNGVTIGFAFVLLAIGLTIIFGLMQVINFAHGELFALGAYFAIVVMVPIGANFGFVAALIIAPITVGLLGILIERFTIRPLYGRDPLYHILLTFGFVLIINDLIFIIWGPSSQSFPLPGILSGTVTVFGFRYAAYNYFMIAFGAMLTAGVWGFLRYTPYGLIVRAGAQDREMVDLLGIDIDRYYSMVFGIGAALAAVAGITVGGYQAVNPDMGMSIIIAAFVIVVIGGLGSFKGAIVAGLLVGVIQNLLRAYVPILEGLIIFLLMIIILLFRPHGIFGTKFIHGEGTKIIERSKGGLLPPILRLRLAFGILVVLALLPLGAGTFYSNFLVTVVSEILVWGLFALALDFVLGYAGMLSFGHALFWAAGAYASILVMIHVTDSIFIAIPVAMVVAGLFAWIVGYFSIRIHGVYFAMITLAFAELFYNLLFKFDFTGGSDGLFGVRPVLGFGDIGIEIRDISLEFALLGISGNDIFYYMILISLVGSFLVTRRLLQSPFGSVLKSIHENEERAQFLGYDTTVYKRRAFVISGVFAGLAGGLFAMKLGFVDPSFGHWLRSGEVIVMVVLGGVGTLVGPILGAGIFFGLETQLTGFTTRWRMIVGTIFVLLVLFLPHGAISLPGRLEPFLPERILQRLDPTEGHHSNDTDSPEGENQR